MQASPMRFWQAVPRWLDPARAYEQTVAHEIGKKQLSAACGAGRGRSTARGLGGALAGAGLGFSTTTGAGFGAGAGSLTGGLATGGVGASTTGGIGRLGTDTSGISSTYSGDGSTVRHIARPGERAHSHALAEAGSAAAGAGSMSASTSSSRMRYPILCSATRFITWSWSQAFILAEPSSLP